MKIKIPNTQSKYIGKCIYCPSLGITNEHVVPEAFGGYHVLRKASCKKCQDITRDRETYLCEHNFNALRFHRGYPRAGGRPKTQRPPDLKIIEGKTPHNAPFRKVGEDKAPAISLFPIFRPPGIMLRVPPTNTIEIIQWMVIDTSKDGAQRQQKLIEGGLKGALAHAQIKPDDFLRVLAKIAHGYAVWNVGLNSFNPLLVPLISGISDHCSYWIGGTFENGPLKPMLSDNFNSLPYQISPFQIEIEGEKFIGCQIRLFATERPLTPIYTVIFGQPTT